MSPVTDPKQPELPPAPSPEKPAAKDVPATADKPADHLTPEEQMERFAQDQKENDWGHQPC